MGAPLPTPQRREGNPERGEEGERGEAEGEEKGGQTEDNRTDIKGTPKTQRATTINMEQAQQQTKMKAIKNDRVGMTMGDGVVIGGGGGPDRRKLQ